MSSSTEIVIQRLWAVRRTLLKMLQDRGYLVSSDEKELTYDEFKAKVERAEGEKLKRDQVLGLTYVMKEDPTKLIMVLFPDDAKVGTIQIQKYIELLNDRNKDAEKTGGAKITRAIMVIQDKLTSYANKVKKKLKFKVQTKATNTCNSN